jgi:predicted transcriptional regulator
MYAVAYSNISEQVKIKVCYNLQNSTKGELDMALRGHEWLKERRLEKGMSLRALAERTGISHAYIREVEDGKKMPGVDVMFSILEGLDSSIHAYLKAIGYRKGKGRLVAVQGIEPRHVGHKNKHLAGAAA